MTDREALSWSSLIQPGAALPGPQACCVGGSYLFTKPFGSFCPLTLALYRGWVLLSGHSFPARRGPAVDLIFQRICSAAISCSDPCACPQFGLPSTIHPVFYLTVPSRSPSPGSMEPLGTSSSLVLATSPSSDAAAPGGHLGCSPVSF